MTTKLVRRTLRIEILAAALCCAGMAAQPVAASVPFATISSPGPLFEIFLGNELSSQIGHTTDGATYEVFPADFASPADYGTFLVVADTLYAPDFANHDDSYAYFVLGVVGTYVPMTPVSQSGTTGSGTAIDPYRVVTVVDVGITGLRVTQTDSYVTGQESYRTDIVVNNTSGATVDAILYRALDCFLGGSDSGYGFVRGTAVGCSSNEDNSPPGRIEMLIPVTGGNNYYEAYADSVWRALNTLAPFDDTCECASNTDNGIGISWNISVPAGGSVTRTHLTVFSPQGIEPEPEVPNESPVLASNQASVTVNEGQTASNTGTVTDADGDTVTLTASVGTVINNGNGTWSWSFTTSDGPPQSQTVTITGDDGQGGGPSDIAREEGDSSTSFSLVVNNVAPTITSVTNSGPILVGGSATITVTATDPAGANDPLAYQFDCDNNGSFEIGPQAGNSASCTFGTAGSRTVNVRVTDGDGGVATGSTVVTVLFPPPSCSNATASPNLIWPPNHKFVAIGISGIVNPAPGAVTITVSSIFQDEPVQSAGSGNTSPDATGVGTANASVRAERDGGNDGRVYHIAFTATGAGGSCTGTVKVGVPKSQGNNGGPVDQGPLYNSTLP